MIPLAGLAVLAGLYALWPEFREFGNRAYEVVASGEQRRVEQWAKGYGGWGFCVLIGLMLMQTLIPVLPSVVAMIAAVLAYGPVWGGLTAWLGMLLAATLGYGIGRAFGPVTVDRMVGGDTRQKITGFVDRYGVWAVIAARISPVLSTDAVSIVAGLAGMRFRHFLLATAVGTLPLTLLIAWLGEDFDRMKSALLWTSAVSVAAFLVYVVYDRHRRKPASDDGE